MEGDRRAAQAEGRINANPESGPNMGMFQEQRGGECRVRQAREHRVVIYPK